MIRKRIAAVTAAISVLVLSQVPFLQAQAAIESPGTAMLIGSLGGQNAQWSSDASSSYPPLSGSQLATVDGDGTYTVSFSIAGSTTPATEIKYLALQIEGVSRETYPSLEVSVNTVTIDGTEVSTYIQSPGSANLNYVANGIHYTRVYLTVTDGWTDMNAVTDLQSAQTVSDNITVTFTVSGTGQQSSSSGSYSSADTATTTTTAFPTGGVNEIGGTTTTTTVFALDDHSAATDTTAVTEDTDYVDNSTTGDAGVAGIVAGGCIAGLVALLTIKKRR